MKHPQANDTSLIQITQALLNCLQNAGILQKSGDHVTPANPTSPP